MAQYHVNFKCGHEEIKDLYGPVEDRKRKIKYWEENDICSNCYRKAQARTINAVEEDYDLPALEGSEKQIAWAKKIRIKMMETFDDYLEKTKYSEMEKDGLTTEQGLRALIAKYKVTDEEEVNKALERLRNMIEAAKSEYDKINNYFQEILTKTSAEWYIDNRYLDRFNLTSYLKDQRVL